MIGMSEPLVSESVHFNFRYFVVLEENWILLVMQWDTLTDKCWESIICISIQLGKDQKYVVYLPFFRLIISDHQEIITLVRFKDLTDLL